MEDDMTKGERRKQELLKIAYEMFLSKGYENTSVDEIIEKAGIAKGTYYYYFPSKEQTLEEVIDMMLDEEEEKAKMILSSDAPIPQKLVGIIASFRPDKGEEAIADALHAPENVIMHEKTERKLMERLVPILSEVGRQGVEEGLFSCDNIPERVREIVILSSALFDNNAFTEADITVFIDTVERILYAPSGSMSYISQLITVEGGNKNGTLRI
jgi:AcrR family transcriptional regulator